MEVPRRMRSVSFSARSQRGDENERRAPSRSVAKLSLFESVAERKAGALASQIPTRERGYL